LSVAQSLAEKLIAAPSVTPARGLVFDVMEGMLAPLGFETHRFIAGDGEDSSEDAPVENLYAIRRGPKGSRHFAFAGHLDVVPPGEGWKAAPFAPEVRGDLLYGRGAVDMKGAIAAMVASVADVPADAGTISFIITGDEEGHAQHGTRALIDYMRSEGHAPDLCLVGEPTSVNQLGDMMKIGRRGSTILWIDVEGQEGHVAYPHLADNPIPRLIKILAELDAIALDEGNDWFQPSNLEILDLTVDNPASNVIPHLASARVSIRFNSTHTGDEIGALVREVVERHGGTARQKIYGEAFLTPPGDFSEIIADAVEQETGLRPEASTTGGTSDARFLKDICPVIEFGLCNATMHKRDEAVALADLDTLSRIYTSIAKMVLEQE
jgi:succinyl-diaminopimelate desuccinylase